MGRRSGGKGRKDDWGSLRGIIHVICCVSYSGPPVHGSEILGDWRHILREILCVECTLGEVMTEDGTTEKALHDTGV